jgi:hypothetical protein
MPPAAASLAALPDERLGQKTAPLLLLSREDVRADLGMTAKQAEEATKAATSLHAQALAIKGMKGPQAIAARKRIDETEQSLIESILSPDQLVRLVQVSLQWEGPAALVSRPVVADTLGLSPEQRASIRKAVDIRNAAREKSSYSLAEEEILARKALSLLNEPQRARWGSMLGRPFKPRIAAETANAATRR